MGWIDTHTHLEAGPGTGGVADHTAALAAAIALMDHYEVRRSLVMPPPAPISSTDEFSVLAAAARDSPNRFSFLAGGRSLNPMIQEAVRAGTVSAELKAWFEQTAREIVATGAVGFGEMTALHLSFTDGHPYEAASPDHLLFLTLADIAAEHDVPIDLHMEAVLEDKPTHRRLTFLSSRNPPTLTSNIAEFERLLAHNRNARIVWVHVGWDNTGDMTADLVRQLLAAHENLFIQVKLDNPPATFQQNRPLDPSGRLRAEWLSLFNDFPDRILLGSDAFFGMPSTSVFEAGLTLTQWLLAQLPPDLAIAIGYANAVRIYRLQ